MHIGIPREIKPLEGRVALTPDAVGDLVRAGHSVFVEHAAGTLSGYPDADYEASGAQIAADAAATYAAAQLIVKVKEPVAGDLAHLRPEHRLFCYLHLAANLELLQRLQDIGLTAVGFETVATDTGQLPLLEPMSDIAGEPDRRQSAAAATGWQGAVAGRIALCRTRPGGCHRCGQRRGQCGCHGRRHGSRGCGIRPAA
jgi:alanine dehydrogenase